ncbi:MAG: ThiF family adenylyltransferase, partial [Solirubrobacteraceae bacterium]
MSPSSAELLREVKDRIEEIDPGIVHERLGNSHSEAASNGSAAAAPVLIDVRETEEFVAGHIPGAKHVPKSYLETRIEMAAPDRDAQIILYCQSGNRSAWAARTLEDDLGYTHVASMTGGITLWKDRGYEVETPRALSAEQRERYSRHLLMSEVGVEGQQKLLDAKVLLLGAGGLGSPTALYLAAAGVGTLGVVDNDVVDLSNLQRQVIHTGERIGVPKVDSAEESIRALNSDVNVVKYKTRIDAHNIMEIIDGYDVIVDG